MRVSDLGEFGLIGRIADSLPFPPADVVVGIGDDVAVLQTGGPEYLLATCDVQVENIHFMRSAITPYQLGRKIIAINVSDIAACGGKPAWALVSLAVAPDTGVDFIDGLYAGMREQIGLSGASIVGGNLSKIRTEMVIDLTLLGKVVPEHLVLRRGALPGDFVLVTGSLGDSRAGLELILHPDLNVDAEFRDRVSARHLTPTPRLKEGRMLGASGKVHSMADVSDGTMGDLNHICRASGVSAEIWVESLPVSLACRKVAEAAGRDPVHWALSGGEDYELLFTASEDSVSGLRTMLEEETGTPCSVIGRITGVGEGIRLKTGSGGEADYALDANGWDHFRTSSSKGSVT